MVGRYLADGWRATPGGKGRVVICASRDEAAEVEERIGGCSRAPRQQNGPSSSSTSRAPPSTAGSRTSGTVLTASASPAGCSASMSHVPVPCSTATPPATEVPGSAAGDRPPSAAALALGIALLAQHAHGVVASIHEADVPEVTVIEGRVVNQRRQYQLVVPPRNRSAFVEGAYGWKLVRQVRTGGPAKVFNLSVEVGRVVHRGWLRRPQLPGLLRGQDAEPGRRHRGQEGRPVVGDPSAADDEAAALPLPRERRPAPQVSPTSQRGRDFGVMLATLANLGYEVEWRVVNAADYGFPQKRRRVLIVGRLAGERAARPQRGPLPRASWRARCPSRPARPSPSSATFKVEGDAAEVSRVVRGDSRVSRPSATPATCPTARSGRWTWSPPGTAPARCSATSWNRPTRSPTSTSSRPIAAADAGSTSRVPSASSATTRARARPTSTWRGLSPSRTGRTGRRGPS